MSYKLRWYQTDACEAAWRFLCSRPGNPVVDLPTGSGKSLVIAEICRKAVVEHRGRVIVLAHRKELLQQNAEKIEALLPDLDIGVYSAGLRSRDTEHEIVIGGIQSVYQRAMDFGQRNLVLIDEAHLVPHDGEGMYRTFIDDLRAANPKLRLIGLTATPFRLDCGPLCRPDAIFQKVCYSAPVRKLIEEKFLCPLVTRPATASVNTDGIRLRGGEFIASEAEARFDTEQVVSRACRELVSLSLGRRSVLVFCSGVRHADHVANQIEKLTGERVEVVTGETPPLERSASLEAFRSGRLRWLCNVDVLTTGFDSPRVDCIAVLRATMSPGLFAQICGRGFRMADGKEDCLILDFGGNIKRHGPLDSPEYGKQDNRQKNAGEAPTKTCPNCEAECLLGAIECPECGWMFPREREPRHDNQADTASEILATPKAWSVEEIHLRRHVKRNFPDAPPTLRCDYVCQPAGGTAGDLNTETISEWVCLEHEGFAFKKAVKWWAQHSRSHCPTSIDEAMDLWKRGALAAPTSITTVKDGKFYRIISRVLDERPETWEDEAVDDPFVMAEADEEAPF